MKPVDLDLEFPCEKIFNYKFNLKKIDTGSFSLPISFFFIVIKHTYHKLPF